MYPVWFPSVFLIMFLISNNFPLGTRSFSTVVAKARLRTVSGTA